MGPLEPPNPKEKQKTVMNRASSRTKTFNERAYARTNVGKVNHLNRKKKVDKLVENGNVFQLCYFR